jgi:vancomycin resistance protein YoaR
MAVYTDYAKMVLGNEKGTMAKLTSTIIEAAIAGFEAQKKSIDAQIAELRGMLTTKPESAEETPTKTTRRKFSAAVRKRMREAQRLRWAKIRGESAPAKKTAKTAKPKTGITAAGRKALSIAMKKRWAAKKAARKQ